jgi:hypothetical protein
MDGIIVDRIVKFKHKRWRRRSKSKSRSSSKCNSRPHSSNKTRRSVTNQQFRLQIPILLPRHALQLPTNNSNSKSLFTTSQLRYTLGSSLRSSLRILRSICGLGHSPTTGVVIDQLFHFIKFFFSRDWTTPRLLFSVKTKHLLSQRLWPFSRVVLLPLPSNRSFRRPSA